MRGGYTMGDGVADARAKVVSAHEESTPTGVLLRIVTQRRELVINLRRGYRPQQMVLYSPRGFTKTVTDIDLAQHEPTGVWTASRVHEKVYTVRDGTDEILRETIYEFTDLIPRTHLRPQF